MTATLQNLLLQGQDRLAESSGSPRLDAEVLLGHVLQANRAHLYANPEKTVGDELANAYLALIDARASGKPVAHLTGEREFWSLALQVTPEVLSPRPETELLVELALERIPDNQSCGALDLGTGSGAIPVAIATERSQCTITATDNSPATLAVARTNADRHCPGRIELLEGSWFAPVSNQKFDVIVSNPPYIAHDQSPLTDPELAYEPQGALYSGNDGLDDIRHIIAAAPAYLQDNGWLLLEHGFDQADAVQRLFLAAGFRQVATANDLAGQPRVTSGCMPK